MNLKLITLIISAVVSLSSCSIQTTIHESTMQVLPSPAAVTKSPATPVPAPISTEYPSAVSRDDILAYAGAAYITLNNNVPLFSDNELTTEAFERYSPLDGLGRCGVAYANVCKEIMPMEERGKIGQIKPSGWHTIKYDFIDGLYLYNRCHLIGYQLTGENANERNLITGTQYLNTQGMLPFENMTANYVNGTGNHVLYRATPIFAGNDLVALGVQLEAKSVEDNGAGVEFNVFCYNVQPGIDIEYTTGDNRSDGSLDVQNPPPTEKLVAAEEAARSSVYVLNTNTNKFHFLSCSSVSAINEKNKQDFTGTRDEAIAQGYLPCKRCNP